MWESRQVQEHARESGWKGCDDSSSILFFFSSLKLFWSDKWFCFCFYSTLLHCFSRNPQILTDCLLLKLQSFRLVMKMLIRTHFPSVSYIKAVEVTCSAFSCWYFSQSHSIESQIIKCCLLSLFPPHLEPFGSGPGSKEQGQQILQGWQVWECHPVLHRRHCSLSHGPEGGSVYVLPEQSGSIRTAGWPLLVNCADIIWLVHLIKTILKESSVNTTMRFKTS